MKFSEISSINISNLWISNCQEDWLNAENNYWRQVSDANIKLEKELEVVRKKLCKVRSRGIYNQRVTGTLSPK